MLYVVFVQVKKRFPTLAHLSEAGILTGKYYIINLDSLLPSARRYRFDELNSEFGFFVPILQKMPFWWVKLGVRILCSHPPEDADLMS